MSEITLKIMEELKQNQRHMSHSQISKYAKCPLAWRYYIVDRLRLNRINTAVGKRTLGKLIHIGLEQHIRSLIPSEVTPLPLPQMYELWLQETIEEMDGILPQEYDMLVELIEQAVMIVNKAIKYLKLDSGKWETVLDKDGVPILEYELYSILPNGTKMLSYIDWLVYDKEYKVMRIIDFKTTAVKKSIGSYDNEVQVSGIYNKALLQNGIIKEHAFSTIIEINAKVLKRPTLNKDGKMSKAQLHTTWDLYKEELLINDLDPNDYMDMRRKLMNVQFVTVHDVLRTEFETQAIWENRSGIVDNIMHALEVNSFPANLNNMLCTSCEYREACKEELGGFGYEGLVDSGIYTIGEEIEFEDETKEVK